jgi:hypothetical protein
MSNIKFTHQVRTSLEAPPGAVTIQHECTYTIRHIIGLSRILHLILFITSYKVRLLSFNI